MFTLSSFFLLSANGRFGMLTYLTMHIQKEKSVVHKPEPDVAQLAEQ